MPYKDPKKHRAYYRDYMRRRRAQDKVQRPRQQLAAEEQLTEAWEKMAEKIKAPALLCCLCNRPASQRTGISDERGRHFVCEPCVLQSYEMLAARRSNLPG
jgi:hypothetical protein